MSKTKQDKQEEISFEVHLGSAKEILEKLSSPDITLAQSVELYKNGLFAIESAQKLLDEAKLIVEEASSK